ncbi:MAG: hypothetical protein HY033_13060 [Ignavibacteriae bacterium]|nr:hypothetical protein [Ignavibacteria bacterium]MBI3365821.1 hypothetical protein [Ignavibacteriota bacterium]
MNLDVKGIGKSNGRLSSISLVTTCTLLLLVVIVAFREICDPDIGFHLRAGEWILEHFKFPDKDPFTYTVSQNDYVDMYWLYQSIMATVNKISGEFGLVLSNALLIAASFAIVLLRLHRKQSIDTISSWSLVLFTGIWATAILFEPQPQTFSWLYLNLILLVLDDYYERGESRLFLLPVIMLLWTNSHTIFVLGWFVVGAYVVSITWRDRKIWTPLTVYAILSIAVSFINPYFAKGVGFPFSQYQLLQTLSVFKNTIAENGSPLSLDGYTVNGQFVLFQPLFAFHSFLLLSVVAFLRRLGRVQLHEVIIFGLFLYIAVLGVKNIGYFVFGTLPMTVYGFGRDSSAKDSVASDETMQQPMNRFSRWWNSAQARLAVNGVSVGMSIILMVTIITNAYYLNYRSNDRFGYRYNPYTLPVKAAQFLRDNKLEGKILNHFSFGGFLIHAIPQKVFIDGRNEVMGEELFGEYYTHWNLVNKKPFLNKYQPEIVIFPHQNDFLWVHYFRQDSTWRLVYADELSAIYLKNGYANHVSRLDSTVLMRHFPQIVGAQVDSILQREYPGSPSLLSFKERYFPQQEIGLSTFCYYDDRFDAAIQIGLNGLARSTVPCPEMYYNLGNYFWEKKDFAHSAYCYERILRTNSEQLARGRLAQIRSGSAQHPTMQ